VAASLGGVVVGGGLALQRAPGMPVTGSSRSVPGVLAQIEQRLHQQQQALEAQTKQVTIRQSALAAEASKLAQARAQAQATPATHATTGASGAAGSGDGGGSGGDG